MSKTCYVKVRESGVWHQPDRTFRCFTKCGVRSQRLADWGVPIWASKSTKPQEPLCRRCERGKR